jgi:diguanylate cyclase (GGDEF)-like protein
VLAVHDVTELRKMARDMFYQANHDPLTGLVNRREFERRLRQVLENAGQDDGTHHALCYMDLDQFKVVNDTCGHAAGDHLLKQLASLLRQHVRESDTLARLGGDEFGLLLAGCQLDKARQIAEGLCEAIKNFRFVWDEKVFTVGVSIGIAAVDASSTLTDVMVAADSACYVAKDQGRNRVHVFDMDDRELAQRHGEMQLISQIQQALDEDRFELRYQRIAGLQAGGRGEHAEILLSMIDPQGARVAPGLFLPAAERYGMMAALDRWVISRALHLAGSAPALAGVEQLAINLSGQSVGSEGLPDFVLQELERSGLDPRRICFEITETAVIANLAKAKHFIRVLREKGCRFALDDFGSGLSSFGYLRNLPVDYLKIDGAFVRHITTDPIDRAMVTSINDMGHAMGIKTIAEFVENEATLRLLTELGVDYAQGYFHHRPEVLG